MKKTKVKTRAGTEVELHDKTSLELGERLPEFELWTRQWALVSLFSIKLIRKKFNKKNGKDKNLQKPFK